MALPSTGAISLNAVNVELGLSGTTTISMNQSTVRTLFQKASGAISMSDGYGKSNVTAPALVGYTGFTSSSNRTIWNTLDFTMSDYNVNGGGWNIGFTVSGGGTITYEWQYLTWYGMNSTPGACGPAVGTSISWSSPNGSAYNDVVSGGGTNTLTFSSVYGYVSTSGNRGIQGYWRLAASNSAGTIYSGWYETRKNWGEYTYDCNCYCPTYYEYCCTCGTCNGCCDENNENCSCDCDGCCGYSCCYNGEVCSQCTGYYDQDVGNTINNYWCT